MGDEFVNTADRDEWVHSRSWWHQRPFMDRVVGHGAGLFGTEVSSAHGPWSDLSDTTVQFHKIRSDTKLLLEGYVTCRPYASARGAVSALVVSYEPFNGWPQQDANIGSYYYQNEHDTATVPFAVLAPHTVPSGDHRAVIAFGSESGTWHFRKDIDVWSLTVTELGAL